MHTKQRIGDFNQRATLKRPVAVANDLNEQTPTWETVGCVYTRVEYPRGASGEGYEGDQQMLVQRVVFVMRFRRDLQVTWRVVFEEQEYDILFVRALDARQYMAVETELRQ